MNKVTKDNKGFSLVELIVVVLIMGILAVALTPQVLKWVNNSRIANDFATMDSVVSALQTALTNENAYAEATNATTEFAVTIQKPASGAKWLNFSGAATSKSTDTTNYDYELYKKFAEYSGTAISKTGTSDDIQVKTSGYIIKVVVSTSGKVTGHVYKDSVADANIVSEIQD